MTQPHDPTETLRPDVPDLPTAIVREAESTLPRISLASEALHEEGHRFWHWLAERAPFARLLTQRVASNEREDELDGAEHPDFSVASAGSAADFVHHDDEPHVPERS